MAEITGISRLEFWGGMLAILGAIFGITLTCFMHVNDRTDLILDKIHTVELEIKDIKLNQAWLERTKVDKE